MSQPSSGNYQKQRFSIYSMMMFISFAALLTGCILLYLELKLWGDIPAF